MADFYDNPRSPRPPQPAVRRFVDLRLDPASAPAAEAPSMLSAPDYPSGLRIPVTHEELEKLGINEDPNVGDLIHFAAMAEVLSFTSGDGEGGPHRRVELQITAISCMENESTEFGDDEAGE